MRRLLFGCAVGVLLLAESAALEAAPSNRAQPDVMALRDQLAALSPKVRRAEAERVAVCAFETSRALAREYGMAGPANFHNFLVNTGLKKRGLCHHWTRDLMQRLAALKLGTLDLHWGAARAGTLREHNALVVTAKGAPFATGLVLDGWRRSGRLYLGAVASDRYPWREDLSECLCRRGKRNDVRTL